ncbi:hypothetical protein BST14_27545, partial [Mycobacterium arosiense ATCC BAA-1401 = DSM 45069]
LQSLGYDTPVTKSVPDSYTTLADATLIDGTERQPKIVIRWARCGMLVGVGEHRYEVEVAWTGATTDYRSYSRNHEVHTFGDPRRFRHPLTQ